MIVKTSSLQDFPICVTRGSKKDINYHRHNYYEFAYVYEGMVDHVLNGEHHILRDGNYFLLSPEDVHTYAAINDEPFRIVNFMFNPSLIDPSFTLETPFKEIIKHPLIGLSHKKLVRSPLGVQFSDDAGILRPIFINSVTEYKQRKVGYINVLRANAVKGIIACLRNVYAEQDDVKKSYFVENIIKYANDNYQEPISLSQICEKLGYSVQYASRIFKEQMGVNFSAYLIQIRMQKACSLLLSTDMTIQQIGNAVGYTNMAFFYRAFKSVVGETPTEFRNK